MILNQNKPLPEFVINFLDYKKNNEKLSDNTIIAYQLDIYSFLEWLKEYFNTTEVSLNLFNKLTIQDVVKWQRTLKNQASTEGRKISSIRLLFDYLNKFKLVDNDVMHNIKKPKIPKKPRKHLDFETSKELIHVAEVEGSLRDVAIIKLFLYSGMRISEITNLDLGDIKGNRVYIRAAKGEKDRIVYIDEDAVQAINNWLVIRPKTTCDSIFVLHYFNKEPYRITDASIRKMIKKFADIIEVEFTPHILRHTYATDQLDAGTPLPSIQKALGHSDIKTTQIYAHTTEKQLMQMAGKVKYK
jgi:site-specific recombinase XerD